MNVTRQWLHRRESLPDSSVDRRRRRLTSLSFALSPTKTHRNHGETGVFGESTLLADRHFRLPTDGRHFNVISTAFPVVKFNH